MSVSPQTPFDLLFAQLTQGMSAHAPSTRVVNVIGYDVDAQHTQAERVVWIPASLDVQPQEFELPGMATPWRQASRFRVSIYGASYDRVLQIHSLLVGWLDLLVGPPMGSVPSDDAAPATIRGTTDLNALSYPYAGLAGKTLDFLRPLKRTLTFPGGELASVESIAAAVNTASAAASLNIRARIIRDDGNAYIELLLPTHPLGAEGAAFSLSTDTATTAASILGIAGDDAHIASGVGVPATSPYRPGYYVGESQPGPRGGDGSATGWGVIVPVTLYRPIVSMQFLVGVILETPFEVQATGGDTPDETVVSTP